MIGIRQGAAVALAAALSLGVPTFAWANELGGACESLARASETLKQVPADKKAKWCACVVEKVPSDQHRGAAALMKQQQEAEAKGQNLSEQDVPAPQRASYQVLTGAIAACLPMMMGASPPPPAKEQSVFANAPPVPAC